MGGSFYCMSRFKRERDDLLVDGLLGWNFLDFTFYFML
jgi:hypothetical protein